MDAARAQLPRHALGEPPQSELAHREGRRFGIALHARRGAGEKNCTLLARKHSPDGLLRHEKTAVGTDANCPLDIPLVEGGEGAANPGARIVYNHIGGPHFSLNVIEQARDLIRLRCIAGKRLCSDVTA
jgi:hypothetical protein